MRLAFIVQRYGADIIGGSEYHCRLIAERLAERHDVEVLTTCARDYITWQNEYPEGEDRIRGVTVRRFANALTRDIDAFNEYSDWIFRHAHTRADEDEWLRRQGPWCPALIDYLERHHGAYEALIFFTYLYAPTVVGVRIDPPRSILVPTAHDEPAIRLSLYQEVFQRPAGIAYNTAVERAFLRNLFSIRAKLEEIVGCGVDLPPHHLVSGDGDRSAHGDSDTEPATAEDFDREIGALGPQHGSRGAVFRRRHRLYGPFVLYGGRIHAGKGCEELIEYFGAYAAEEGDATLVLMGVKLMAIPEEPFIRFAGLLPDDERLDAVEAATVVAVPSPYESLSLLALEAFAMGTPVLANAQSDVVTDHCQRSNAGLYYADRDEFVACLKLLIRDHALRHAMGRNGQAYVREHYRWDVIVAKYERMIGALRGAGGPTPRARPRGGRGPQRRQGRGGE